MFTIKATYRSETRKFVFTNSSEFPSYRALQDQLLRVFPIGHHVYLSKLLFSPTGDNSARLLIGVEVHSEDEYETHVKPYRGKQWPGALLRFSVFDESSLKLPSVLSVSTEETNTATGADSSEDAQPPVLDITGPAVPEGRRALRSLLDSRSSTAYTGRLHWPDLENRSSGTRELPHPPAFHPAKHPYYGLGNSRDTPPSPWRWLPPPPPIPATAPPRAHNPDVPAPPHPLIHTLRPASSMPVLRESEVPPPPPPRPAVADWMSFIPTSPPPVPARPEQSPESNRLAQGHLLQRLARRSRPEPDVEQHPMNANRHSWAGGVPSKAQSLDDYLRESTERGAAETSALAKLFVQALDKRGALERRSTDANLATSESRERRRAALLEAQRQLREKQEEQARAKRLRFDWDPWSFDDIKPAEANKENVAEPKNADPSVPVVAPSTSTTKNDAKGRAIVIEADSSDELEIPVRVDKGKRPAHRVKFTASIEDKTKGKTSANPVRQTTPAVPLVDHIFASYRGPVQGLAERQASRREEMNARRHHMPRKPVPSVSVCADEAADKATSAALQLSAMQSQFEQFRDSMKEVIEAVRQQKKQPVVETREAPPAATAGPVAPATSEPVVVTEGPKVVHTTVRCDMCDKTIEGVRHKCLDCPDYDLCTPCLTAARVARPNTINAGEAHVIGGHQPNHIFFPIEEAGDLWLHTVFKGAETTLPAAGPVEHTGIAVATSIPEEPATHRATCDLCDSSIVGSRFKCLDCPDWDACASCFTIVGEQHPGHGFVEVKDPDALKQYRNILGSSRSKMHHASCDECKDTIRGVRYKCMHPSCPDYDLCERCEALPHPVHPATHAFLKLRSPDLPISLFRAPPAPAYQVPPPPPVPVAPAPRLPTPPSFLPVIEMTSSESIEEPPAPVSHIQLAPTMPGGLPMSPVISASSRSPPAIEAIVTKEPLVVPGSEDESPYVTPARTPVFPQVPTEAPRASSANEVDRMLAYAQDAIAQADEVIRSIEEPAAVVEEPEQMKTEEVEKKESTTGTTTGTGTPSVQSRMSLPHVPPTDLTELFDLAAQFRHVWAQTHSAGFRTPPVLSPIVQSQPQQIPTPIEVKVEVQRSESIETPAEEPQPQVEMTQREPAAVSLPRSSLPSVPSSVSVPAYSIDSPSEPVAPAQPSPLSTHSLLASPPPVVPRTVRSFVQPSRYEQVRRSGPLPEMDSRPTSLLASEASRPLSMVTDDASTVVGAPAPLRAAFVADNNIPDGQVFPPGAEFVKSWAMVNDGPAPWPASTEVIFVAGDRLGLKGDRFKVGRVLPGEEIDVWTGEMKAPEVPGKYISYWRLSDGQGNRFGHSIWVDIVVAENTSSGSSESSMAASSIIMMPQPASTGTASVPAAQDEATTASVSAAAHDDDVDSQSSVSFLDVPSDEEDIFEDSQSRAGPSPAAPGLRSPADEFVVLYDSSDDEELL